MMQQAPGFVVKDRHLMRSFLQRSSLPPRSIRAHTGFIFFIGLLILIGITIVIALLISQGIRIESARIVLLSDAQAAIAAWAASADTEKPAPPPAEVSITLDLLLRGGNWTGAAGETLHLPAVADERERALLGRAQAIWAAIAAAPGPANTSEVVALQATLAEAREWLHQQRDSNTGMVRGMYAALFVASLIFLLIGLWFIQQTIVSPLEALHQAVARIAAGDLDTPVTLSGPGEFEELAHSFEGMRLELRESHVRQAQWAGELEARLTERTDQLAALSQVIAAASRSLAVEQVLIIALEQCLQALRLKMGGIWLLDETGQTLQLTASSGMSEALRRDWASVGMTEGPLSRTLSAGLPIVLEDLTQASAMFRAGALQEGLYGLVAVPIRLRERVLGVLTVMNERPRIFTPNEVALLTSIGQQIGIAVDSMRLLQEVRAQTQRLAAMQERERIGIELHDGLLQTLGYLFLRTDQLEALAAAHGLSDLAQQLAAQRDVLEHASNEARRFIAELREPPPPPAALQEALAETIVAFEQEHAVPVSLQMAGARLVLDAASVVHLTRIVREALTNAVQHGRATQAVVRCRTDSDAGEIEICDDGCGFDVGRLPDDGRPHFGLSVMQARAARIGGTLQVTSQRGQGTCVRVRWPRPAPNQGQED
ncbi:MAG: GAF domain-containing protein [Anaerolineae bacterium]